MRTIRSSWRLLGLLALVAAATGTASDSLADPNNRAYAAAGTCVKVDGAPAPGVTATVVDTQTAAGTTTAATLMVSPTVTGPATFSWLTGTLDGRGSKKSVELLHLDVTNLSVRDSEALDPASIQQLDFPAMDGTASRQTAQWTLRLSTTSSRRGGPQPGPVSCGASAPSKMFTSSFRVEIDAFDMNRVVRVEPIIVQSTLLPSRPTTRLATEPLGASPLPRRAAATSSTTISGLVLTTTTSGPTLPALQGWLSGDRAPKNGAIVYLAPDFKTVLCTARLTGLTITKITVDSAIARAKAEMTIGGVSLSCP